MEINDRIRKVIEYYGLSVNQFEVKICTTRGKIYKGLERDSDFGSTTISKILDHCDNISPDWLLLGKGEMLRHATPNTTSPDLLNMVSLEKYEKKVEECALLRAQLDNLRRQAARYAAEKGEHSTIMTTSEI